MVLRYKALVEVGKENDMGGWGIKSERLNAKRVIEKLGANEKKVKPAL